jgi:hypothetical protein
MITAKPLPDHADHGDVDSDHGDVAQIDHGETVAGWRAARFGSSSSDSTLISRSSTAGPASRRRTGS